MFANLKNKLIEEVKASPSKFQQFAAAVSSSASTTPSGSDSTTTTTTNENFFSITEEDTPQNSPYKPLKLPPGALGGRIHHNGPGAIPRTRKLSNSSMASDVSFRLPSYESPPAYHLQSDLESNCSELEDTASTTKLDVITKEQLYDAYKKSLDRYHKYRSRYTDLANRYKDLERDSTKARSVLVETQEKAIRRISELREQCSLEQKAKAHLEEALRMEMDDMQCKMQAYETKLKLLGENPDNVTVVHSDISSNDANGGESLIDLDDSSHNQVGLIDKKSSYDTGSSNNDAPHLTQLKTELEERERKIEELLVKMSTAEDTITQLRKQEGENALLLAQTKQAIHSELETKESEVKKLTETIAAMQKELQDAAKKEKQLSGQLSELNELREKVKSLHEAKQESDAKLIASEHILGHLKEQEVSKENESKALEEKLSKAVKESEQKLDDLRQHNHQLNEMVQRYQQNEVSLAEIDNELNRTKNENDILKASSAENERKLQDLESKVVALKEQLERRQQERQAEDEISKILKETQDDNEIQRQLVKQLESELEITNERNQHTESETISALKDELHKLNDEMIEKVRDLKEQIAGKEKELKTNTNKLAKQKKQFETQQNRMREQSVEIDVLRTELNKHEQHLSNLQTELQEREKQAEEEKGKLRAQVKSILQDIGQIQEEMRTVKESHDELEEEKLKLEQLIKNMQQETQETIDGSQRWRDQLIATEDKLRQVESKLQNVETENSQLAEKNCLLEEQNNRFEKQLLELERQKIKEEAIANELRLKLETAESAVQKLNEKMSQVLDENSRMHNTQELMDHDYRTLQDKLDVLEKEKIIMEDDHTCLQQELETLRERRLVMETRLRETVEQLQQAEEKCAEQRKNADAYEEELKEMTKVLERFEKENQTLITELNNLRAAQSDDEKLHCLMRDQKRRIEELEHESIEKDENFRVNMEAATNENTLLKEKLNRIEETCEELEQLKEECQRQKAQNADLNQEISILNTELSKSRESCQELVTQSVHLKVLMDEKEGSEKEIKKLVLEINKLKEDISAQVEEVQIKAKEVETLKQQLENSVAINEKLANTETELTKFREMEKKILGEAAISAELANKKIQDLENQLSTTNNDIERLHESNDAIQVEMDKLQSKSEMQLQSMELTLRQLRDENEKLQQQVAQLKIDGEKLTGFEQLQIENEYLNKHVRQLEIELEAQRTETSTKLQEEEDLREKLKSLQCELYVLRENAEKHDKAMAEKQAIIDNVKSECKEIREVLANERSELERQLVHAKYITEQNDVIQSDLLNKQHQLTEVEQQLQDAKLEIDELKSVHATDADTKSKEVDDLRAKLQQAAQELNTKIQLQRELDAMRIELAEHNNSKEVSSPQNLENGQKSGTINDAEHLRRINEALQRELEELKHKSTAEIAELQQEIEDMQSNAKHMTEELVEAQKLRPQEVEAAENTNKVLTQQLTEELSGSRKEELLQKEKDELVAKLHIIMNEVRDVSERNIFLEQQCENYLILEQSNERLKLQNAKLSRQLDETLVSMQHNEGITANTEFEYLKNIMFQYLTGSANGNNETLVKVISAVLKFSPQQTQVALEKEHQRRSLLNKIL